MEKKYCAYSEIPLTLRVEELMPILGIGRNTAYELVSTGQIRGIKVGSQLRIPKQSLIHFLEAGNNSNQTDA